MENLESESLSSPSNKETILPKSEEMHIEVMDKEIPGPSTKVETTTCQRSPSPELNKCAICLGELSNEACPSNCCHKFCFSCLLEWSKVKNECPLCKTTFSSIYHNIKRNNEYDEYIIPPSLPSQPPTNHYHNLNMISNEIRLRMHDILESPHHHHLHHHHRHPTHEDHNYNSVTSAFIRDQNRILRIYEVGPMSSRGALQAISRYSYENPFNLYHHREPEYFGDSIQLPNAHTSSSSLSTTRHPPFSVSGYQQRKRIYDRNQFVLPFGSSLQPSVIQPGSTFLASVEYLRSHPQANQRIVPWLYREIQVLLGLNRPVVTMSHVFELIMGLILRYDIRSVEFSEMVKMYFGNKVRHFQHEFYHFVLSGMEMEEFDRVASYSRVGSTSRHGHRNPYGPPLVVTLDESDNDNDDIEILEQNNTSSATSSGLQVQYDSNSTRSNSNQHPHAHSSSSCSRIMDNNSDAPTITTHTLRSSIDLPSGSSTIGLNPNNPATISRSSSYLLSDEEALIDLSVTGAGSPAGYPNNNRRNRSDMNTSASEVDRFLNTVETIIRSDSTNPLDLSSRGRNDDDGRNLRSCFAMSSSGNIYMPATARRYPEPTQSSTYSSSVSMRDPRLSSPSYYSVNPAPQYTRSTSTLNEAFLSSCSHHNHHNNNNNNNHSSSITVLPSASSNSTAGPSSSFSPWHNYLPNQTSSTASTSSSMKVEASITTTNQSIHEVETDIEDDDDIVFICDQPHKKPPPLAIITISSSDDDEDGESGDSSTSKKAFTPKMEKNDNLTGSRESLTLDFSKEIDNILATPLMSAFSTLSTISSIMTDSQLTDKINSSSSRLTRFILSPEPGSESPKPSTSFSFGSGSVNPTYSSGIGVKRAWDRTDGNNDDDDDSDIDDNLTQTTDEENDDDEEEEEYMSKKKKATKRTSSSLSSSSKKKKKSKSKSKSSSKKRSKSEKPEKTSSSKHKKKHSKKCKKEHKKHSSSSSKRPYKRIIEFSSSSSEKDKMELNFSDSSDSPSPIESSDLDF